MVGLRHVLERCVAMPAAQIQPYTIAILFDVPGLQFSYPLEINDNGQVVGTARFTGDDRSGAGVRTETPSFLRVRWLSFNGHAAPTLSGFMLVPYLPSDAAIFQRTRVLRNGVSDTILNPVFGNSETAVYGTDINESGVAVGFVLDLDDHAGPFAFTWQERHDNCPGAG